MPKVLVFYGPSHWSQLLTPVVKELQARGWEHIPYTANAEAAFEISLNEQAHLQDFKWLPDFAVADETQGLYQEAVAYFQELYATPSPVSLMVPPVTDRILSELATDWHATRHLLDEVKPDVCLGLHELCRWTMILGYWCAVQGIPFFTSQEGLYYGHDWIYRGHTRYSRSLVWGEAAKKKLLAGGSDPHRIYVLGHPDLADREKWAQALVPEARAGLPPDFQDKKIVTVFFTNITLAHVNVANLLAGLAEAGTRLVFDFHNLGSLELKNKVREVFKDQIGKLIHLNERPLWALPLVALSSAVVVVGCSTLGLETLHMGKPLVELFAPGQPVSFVTDYDVAVGVGERPLIEAVKEAENLFTFAAHNKKVQAFLRDQLAHPNAAGLIADHICQAVRHLQRERA